MARKWTITDWGVRDTDGSLPGGWSSGHADWPIQSYQDCTITKPKHSDQPLACTCRILDCVMQRLTAVRSVDSFPTIASQTLSLASQEIIINFLQHIIPLCKQMVSEEIVCGQSMRPPDTSTFVPVDPAASDSADASKSRCFQPKADSGHGNTTCTRLDK